MSRQRSVHRPRSALLPEPLARAARAVAERLVEAGHEAWIVGGAVRDLALGLVPHEIDFATEARPERVEALFERTALVGKAFGTVIVVLDGQDVEVTTFRSESGYSDARRPDRVTFGSSVEEDAERRDFTCNALFLAPASDELRDPTGGLADLERGLLRTVGEASERFAEDGLRLLRMARFAAQLDLEPAPGLVEAARAGADTLRGVSVERVLGELERMLSGPAPGRALGLLEEAGLLERALPALAPLGAEERRARIARLAALGRAPASALGFALLLDASGDGENARRALEELRASNALRRSVGEAGALLAELTRIGSDPAHAPRSAFVRAARSSVFAAIARAPREAWSRGERAGLEALEAALGHEPDDDVLRPAPLVRAEDLAALGLAPGPAWGLLLEEAETAQLDGELADRARALAWLARRAREIGEPQDGGKTRRSAKDTG